MTPPTHVSLDDHDRIRILMQLQKISTDLMREIKRDEMSYYRVADRLHQTQDGLRLYDPGQWYGISIFPPEHASWAAARR